MPIHLGTNYAGAPPEKGNKISPMRHALHRPEGQLSRTRSRTLHPCCPSIRPGLLLHDSKMRADRTYLRQMLRPASVIQILRLLRRSVQPIGKAGIGIIHVNIQIFLLHAMVIHIPEHSIGHHIIPGLLIFAYDFCLHTAI